MRYRPFAHFNLSVSAVSLALTDDGGARPVEDWVALLYGALEAGINTFEVQGRHPNIAKALEQTLQAVDRRLVVVIWRIGPRSIPDEYAERAFQPQIIQAAVKSALVRSQAGHIDILLLDDPGESALPPQSLAVLKQLKAQGVVRLIGVAGEDDAIDAYISTGAFDALALPFSMISGWRDRLRLRAAKDAEMAVIGYGAYPDALHPVQAPAAVKRSFWDRAKAAPVQAAAYDFLRHTPQWDSEAICLAYALTEPSIATVQVTADDAARLQVLAATADRDLPAGLGAQIEMARINAGNDPDTRRRA